VWDCHEPPGASDLSLLLSPARVHAESYDEYAADRCADGEDEEYDDEEEGWSSSGSYGRRSPRPPSGGSLYGRSPPHRCVAVVEHPLAGSHLSEEAELQLALALSLGTSLGGDGGGGWRRSGGGGGSGSMPGGSAPSSAGLPPRPPPQRRGVPTVAVELSYEQLVQLEDVRLTATEAVVDTLRVVEFDAGGDSHGALQGTCCVICMEAYSEGDMLLQLPCSHVLHNQPCGREYLLKWSKRCPECKASVVPEDD